MPKNQYKLLESTSLFKIKGGSANNFRDCLVDWQRSSGMPGRISINKVDVNAFIADFSNLAQEKDLINLWNEKIIKNIVRPKRSAEVNQLRQKNMLEYMKKFMHQGGCLQALTKSLSEHALSQGYLIDSNYVKSKIDIRIRKGKLIVTENMQNTGMCRLDNPTHLITPAGNKKYIVKGKLVHRIAFNSKNEIVHKIETCSLKYDNHKTETLLDKRSLTQKVADFINKKIFKKKDVFVDISNAAPKPK